MTLRNRDLFKEERCFFVTTVCRDKKSLIELSNSYEDIKQSLKFVCKKYEVSILGYVIKPNHLHLILFFKKDNEVSSLMRDFKKFISSRIRMSLESKGHLKLVESLKIEMEKRVFQIWENRFDLLVLTGKKNLERVLDYIHLNPLQEYWNLAEVPEDYDHSSAAFYEVDGCIDNLVVDYREYF